MDQSSSLVIGHRANTLDDIFHYYYKHDLRMVELDAQLTQDKKIAIFHEDVSMKRMKHLIRENIIVLDEVLKNIPSDLTLNIEIKRYESLHAKQNKVPNDIVTRLIMAVKKRGKKNVIYSSFDREIVRIIMKNRRESILLINTEEGLDDLTNYPKISVDKVLLPKLNVIPNLSEKEVYVYDVQYGEELESLKASYPFVKGWIADYDFKSPH
jgi:glycerophosphoryl diester phosphodiesterase